MREILKKSLSLLLSFLLFILISCDGFNLQDINFNENIRTQLQNDLAVTYSFYELPDLTSSHIDKVYMMGKTVTESSFPKYTQENKLLVGWGYMKDGQTEGVTLPSNFTLNQKNYISSFRVAGKAESLYAVWKNKRTVTFVTNVDDITIDPVILPEGDKVSAPQVEYRHGDKRFYGWYTDAEFTTRYEFNLPVMEDITLYAKWVNVFTVTYYKNDGTEQRAQQEYEINADYTHNYADCMFGVREGYGFVGWSSSPTGEVTCYSGDEIPNILDLELYAVWSTNVITITYIDKSTNFESRSAVYGQGAHISVGRVLSDNDNWYRSLNEIWKIDGKEIAGFSTNADDDLDNLTYDRWGGYDSDPDPENYVWKNYIAVTESMTFYTYWKDIVYTVYFRYTDNDGHDCWFGNGQTVGWNQCLTRPDTVPLLPGKTFDDWYLGVWVGNSYVISSTPFDFTTVFNDDVWEGNRYIHLFAKFTEGGASTGEVTTTISFEESPLADIQFSAISINRSTNQIQLTAPAGYNEYHWYINGTENVSLANLSSVTLDTSSWTSGLYDITLIVFDGSEYYSCQGTLTKN